MKRNLTLALFCIVLSLVQYSFGQKEQGTPKTLSSLRIAFYDQDSLKSNFLFYKEKDEYIQKKQEDFQSELKEMTEDYQSFVSRNEERIRSGLLSEFQITKVSEDVQKKERRIIEYEQTTGLALEQETVQLLEEIGKKIADYSKEFCEKNKIDILLIQAPGGQIGYITPNLEVTNDFIAFLNAKENLNESEKRK